MKNKIEMPTIYMAKINELLPYVRNTKLHPPRQIKKIAMSIEQYGFNVPIIVDGKNEIISGHGRLLAAKELKVDEVPCVRIEHLTPEQIRAFRIADNKVAESEWEAELLDEELKRLFSDNYELEMTGFDLKELSEMLIDVLPQDSRGEEFTQDEAKEYENPYSGKRKEDDLPEEEEAIEFWEWLKGMEDVYVMFSGGKDSMAMLACLLDHGVVKEKMTIVHNRTPLDYPGLGEFVETFARKEGIRIDMIGLKNSFEDTCRIMENTASQKVSPQGGVRETGRSTRLTDIAAKRGFTKAAGKCFARDSGLRRAADGENLCRGAFKEYTKLGSQGQF